MKNNKIKNGKFNGQIPKINCQLSIVNCHQRGASLIITFLIMTVMLAIVLSISVILLSEIKIVGNMGNSVLSLYASESGIEKTLYLDRKKVPPGGNRGFCNICGICSPGEGINYCNNCTITFLDNGSGCNPLSCTNCQVDYNSTFNGRNYTVKATVIPNPPNSSIFNVNSRGLYKDTIRVVEAIVTP